MPLDTIGLPVLIAPPAELAARTRGDERAFATLVDRYRPIVFRWAIGLSGDEDEAEDITQEVSETSVTRALHDRARSHGARLKLAERHEHVALTLGHDAGD